MAMMVIIIKVKSERFVRSISFTLLLLCSSYGDVHVYIILCLQVADCVLVHVSFTLGEIIGIISTTLLVTILTLGLYKIIFKLGK